MESLDLFHLSQEMRDSPEFRRLQQLDRFSHSLRIFEANYRELDRMLRFICESTSGERLFRKKTALLGNRRSKKACDSCRISFVQPLRLLTIRDGYTSGCMNGVVHSPITVTN
jgi:hypothetical protein